MVKHLHKVLEEHRTAVRNIRRDGNDLIKKAMIDINLEIKKEKLGAKMLLQVHDELLFEVPRLEREPADDLIRRKMEAVRVLDVPLKVEIGWGANWTEAHA